MKKSGSYCTPESGCALTKWGVSANLKTSSFGFRYNIKKKRGGGGGECVFKAIQEGSQYSVSEDTGREKHAKETNLS